MKFYAECPKCENSQKCEGHHLHTYIFKCRYCGKVKKLYNKKNGQYQLDFWGVEN